MAVMYPCRYDVRSGRGCTNEQTLDFEYCNEHLKTPRGRQHIMDTLDRRNLTVPSQIQQAIEHAKEIPEKDVQTTALERMVETLDRILEWEESARKIIEQIPVEDRRFLSRGGDEQVRSEVAIYERALDRTAKTLAQVSKMAIDEKTISLGRAQTELMIRILMGVITEMRLDNPTTDKARATLLKKFREEANLQAALQDKVTKELTSAPSPIVQMPAQTGGVTAVSIAGVPVYSQGS